MTHTVSGRCGAGRRPDRRSGPSGTAIPSCPAYDRDRTGIHLQDDPARVAAVVPCPMLRRRLPRPTWVDVVLATVVTAVGAVEVAVGQLPGPLWAVVPSVLLFGIPLLWRRQFPWTALLVCYGTILCLHLIGTDQYNYLASVASALLIMF